MSHYAFSYSVIIVIVNAIVLSLRLNYFVTERDAGIVKSKEIDRPKPVVGPNVYLGLVRASGSPVASESDHRPLVPPLLCPPGSSSEPK